jgi:hypothetical protein
MIKTFTENDLIRYIYGETSENEKTEIENAAVCDPEMDEELRILKSIYQDLNELVIVPSERVISKILNYSIS